MIEITYHRGRHGLTVTGHAGLGVKGADPLCAAVSALTYTAGANLAELAGQGNAQGLSMKFLPGYAKVGCQPEKGMEQVATLMLDTVVTGFQLLQAQWPEHIKLRLVEG